MNLYKTLGTSPDHSLLADAGEVRIGIAIHPGEGELDRGTIMVKNATTGMYKAATSGAIAGHTLAVLDETTDAGTELTGVGVTARAYEQGTFIKEKVLLAGGGTLAEADIVALAAQGIMLRVMNGTVNNVVT